MTTMKYYEITWKDHFSETGWKDKDELEKWVKDRKKHPCVSIGQIVYEDDDVIVLAGSHDGEDSHGDFMAIYKNHIIKKRIVK
jgi:hypothetical protein